PFQPAREDGAALPWDLHQLPSSEACKPMLQHENTPLLIPALGKNIPRYRDVAEHLFPFLAQPALKRKDKSAFRPACHPFRDFGNGGKQKALPSGQALSRRYAQSGFN